MSRAISLTVVGGLIAACLATSGVWAAAASKKPSDSAATIDKPASEKPSFAERMRPSGPVTVTATNVDWAKGGMMVYTGNVKLSSDTLKLDGDKLELEQLAGGEFKAKVTGGPAHLQHEGDPAAKDQPEPPVTARAKLLIYDSKSGIVDVTGDALVTRGEDQITGESIRYNVTERRIQAAGGEKGQVKIVIQPPPRDKTTSTPAKPAASNPSKQP